jgi:hypothetical protein
VDPSHVLGEITAAFEGLSRPETSLRQYKITDSKGMAGTITLEEWQEAGTHRIDNKWQDIPDSEVRECDVLLAHMSSEDFQYYLPAYMSYAIKHPLDGKPDIIGMTVTALSPSTENVALRHYALSQFSTFTSQQRHAVVQFLRFAAEHSDPFLRPYAEKALQRHWTDKVVKDGFDMSSLIVVPR